MVIGCTERTPKSSRRQAALANMSSWVSKGSKSGFKKDLGTVTLRFIESSYLPQSSFSSKTVVLYDTITVSLSFLVFLLVVLTRKLLFLLWSSSSAAAFPFV